MIRTIARVGALACTLLPISFSAAPQAAARPLVEVAFVLDTTGSMAKLIEGAKRKIWSIATTILDCNPEAEVRMGIVAYRDIGDDYVTKTFDLTTDIQDMYAHLLELKARGGGDWPESVNEALHVGVGKLSWTHGHDTTRIVFLVGDAPPHMDYQQDKKYPEVLEIARKRGIVVNAVQAGNARDTERVWRSIAQLGHGDYIPIPQDGGAVVVIETPYDRQIIELQGRINGTVVPYGSRADQERVANRTKQVAAAPAPAATEMASYINRRARAAGAGEAVTGGGDLVADVTQGRKDIDAITDAELPEGLRSMSRAERKAQIDKLSARRTALNAELEGLVRQRDQYVLDQRKKEPAKAADSFDRAVEGTLRKQIAR
jgi:hypothetical protein